MNIFNTPKSNVKGKAAAGSGADVLSLLGNQKNLTPEQIKLLQKKGKLKADTGEFETLFKQNKKQAQQNIAQQTNQVVDPKLQALQSQLKNNKKAQNLDVLNQPVKENTQALQKHQVLNPKQQVKVAGQAKLMSGTEPLMAQSKLMTQNGQALQQAAPLAASKEAIKQDPKQAINSKLVDFNTFMQKQTPQTRGRIAAQSEVYQNAVQKSKSLFAKKVNTDEAMMTTAKSAAKKTSLQDIMFKSENETQSDQNMQQDQSSQLLGKLNGKASQATLSTAAGTKVFDMNQMTSNMGQNEVITKIQDYAIQTRAGNERQLDFSFRHNDLGKIDLTIQKLHNNQLNISIGTNSIEGAQFFSQNQGELLQSLTQAGISVGDLKLEAGKSNTSQNLAGDFGKDSDSSGQKQKQHGSESGEREQEQSRRQELWSQFKDKEAA
ncbi:MAG: hypothetical protein CME62_14540 [Halobacteriovoraceae bacterium]|nr:hypothetical protein [Halobacteriovoraceae bacterium]